MDGEAAASGQKDVDGDANDNAPPIQSATSARNPSEGATARGETRRAVAGSIDDTPRVLRWVRKHAGRVPGWALPVGVIVATGWLGHATNETVVSFWLGLVATVIAYAVASFALEPAAYAQRLAAATAVTVGLGTTQLLLNHVGHSIL